MGTPFVYQGDELGMTNYPFKSIEEFNDIAVRNAWKASVEMGKVSAESFLANICRTSRDNARTPMQWDGSAQGGFTTGAKPWLAVNPNYTQINAAQETSDPKSVYNYYRRMIELRGGAPALVYGDYADLDAVNPNIFAYTRTLGKEKYLVVLNFSSNAQSYTLPARLKAGQAATGNLETHEEHTATLHLEPWEARIYRQ
jgi:oligo-1,6-glucosidase